MESIPATRRVFALRAEAQTTTGVDVRQGEARSAPDASLGSGGVALTVLPDDLVNTNAYLLWVDSGRPDGTEFLRASRDLLEADLRSGRQEFLPPWTCSPWMPFCPPGCSLLVWSN